MRKEKKNLRGGWLPQILCGLLLSFTLFLFGPVDMYLANASDFWFDLEHFVPLTLLMFAVVFLVFELVFFLIRRFLPRPVYLILLAMAFGLGFMLYLQGNWLCLGNELMIGSTPKWRNRLGSSAINLVIWFVVINACVVFSMMKTAVFKKAVCYVSALVLIMQLVSLGTNLVSFTSAAAPAAGEIYTTTEDRFTVSDNGDVLVFMVDSVDTRFMDEMLETYPQYLSELDGFTYYRNNGGLFDRTDPSVVGMLTGKVCKNEEPFFDFAHKAFSEDTLLSQLKENGYTINFYATPKGIFGEDMFDVIGNLSTRESVVDDAVDFMSEFMVMVGYRYLPLMVQPFIHDDFAVELAKNQGFEDGALPAAVMNDATLYQELKEDGIVVDNSRRFFKYYRMRGSHEPYTLNSDGEAAEGVSVVDQTCGVFTILGDYFKCLKEDGLYDSATIIIVADHGKHEDVTPNAPTLLVKYPNQRSNGEIRVSEAPTSLLDLRATMAYGLGFENYADFGTPVHEWEGVLERERYTYRVKYRMPPGNNFYLNPVVEYIVPKLATDYSAYEATGVVYSKK